MSYLKPDALKQRSLNNLKIKINVLVQVLKSCHINYYGELERARKLTDTETITLADVKKYLVQLSNNL